MILAAKLYYISTTGISYTSGFHIKNTVIHVHVHPLGLYLKKGIWLPKRSSEIFEFLTVFTCMLINRKQKYLQITLAHRVTIILLIKSHSTIKEHELHYQHLPTDFLKELGTLFSSLHSNRLHSTLRIF